MSYYPFFRGKQFELITIRESAQVLAGNNFIPIIEPVKQNLKPLEKCLDILIENACPVIIVQNPSVGHFKNDKNSVYNYLSTNYPNQPNIIYGYFVKDEADKQWVSQTLRERRTTSALIHAGLTNGKLLATEVQDLPHLNLSIFIDNYCGKLYQRHFSFHEQRVLIKNGFEKQNNRDYKKVEFFSDLHLTYPMENQTGYGDFLTVGDTYSESGGPAYAVAIHITFVDAEDENQMYMYHFVSDRKDTPTDPAGKFAEALNKLIDKVNEPNSKIYRSSSIKEFIDLHERRHFPGLGYVKKLSMNHHIETLASI